MNSTRWAVLAAATLAHAAAGGVLHPQDGPHADIRITIGDEAVRFDVTMNLAFVDEIAPTEREYAGALPEVEAPFVEAALAEYFRVGEFVTIDGVIVTPRLDGFQVLRPGVELLPLFPRSGMRGLLRVGFDLWYPLKSPPKQIAFVWRDFPPDLVALGDEEGEAPPMNILMRLHAEGTATVLTFTVDEPEHIWHATGMTLEDRFAHVPAAPPARPTRLVPVLSLGLLAIAALALLSCVLPGAQRRRLLAAMVLLTGGAGATLGTFRVEIDDPLAETAPLPTADDALSIFRPLHENIYRAFDYVAENDVYDALSRSVEGQLLDRLYNEIYRSLIMYEEGGAVSRIKSVTPSRRSR